MTRTGSMPGWLKVVLTVLAVVVLGPPALALLGVALAVTLSLGVLAMKLAVVALVVVGAVALFRAIFGGSPKVLTPAPPAERPSIEDLAARMERDERQRREELDRELEAAVHQAR